MHKLIEASVFAAFGILIFASLLIPVVNDANDQTIEMYNNNYGSFAILLSEDSATLTIDEDGNYFVNSEPVPITTQTYILMFDTGYLRYSSTAHEFNYQDEGGYHHTSTLPQTYNIANGEINATIGETTLTIPFNWCGIATNSGDYRTVVTTGTVKTVYVNNYDQVYGVMKSENNIISLHGDTITYAGGVFSDMTVSYTGEEIINSSISPIYKLRMSTNVDNSDIKVNGMLNNETEISYSHGEYLIPYEVIGQTDANHAVNTLLSILPIIVLFVLVMGIVGVALYQRIE